MDEKLDEKMKRLYRLLEDASREVKTWPEWRRSEDSRQEMARLAAERQQARGEGEPARPTTPDPAP